ncbi:pyruvate decarboxylase [Parastagonospora nodorum]|nr:pyruvate decarboxylase [Parastagonospora nodorum]KAH3971023.1 pyruvate decarboxylase [Parastagonospora nodorum]KAH4065175.1 pyruvate decarboxylase [Parastagonospora nodorum]KAH4084574.1 pyruvate decarboxylase [Parastagonospora nodorum]KAH4101900.1 pyruvate decarboxylase [Parastagonospora nodorum]
MAQDLRSQEIKNPVDVAEYLFRRLQQVGVESIHGVPGDYNLVALDYIPKVGLRWVGNCNELNAGYAADGYARVKGISALVTTFGVGELSAVNAIAGAYSEYVPIVHIVGYPSTLSQKNGALLHHTLGNGDFTVFSRMSKEISCAVSMLNHQHEAAMLIDNAIRECILQSRPVYISLPSDMVQKKIDGDRLNTPLDLNYPPNDQEAEDYVVDVVLKYLHAAKNPVIVVDGCAIRHRALEETHDLVAKSGIPTFVAPMGKGAVDETLPNYGGVYAGDGSNAGVKDRVESADLVLSIGAIQSDFNTAGFTVRMSQMNTIDFHSYAVKVRYSEYPGVRMNGVLAKVTAKLGKLNIESGPEPNNTIPNHEKIDNSNSTITHAYLWPRLGQWLQPHDILITETGTSNFGVWETRFPADITAISQVLWGSIGYATGSCQGAALAAREKGIKRTILFTGDGSFQLTAQEISTMLRHKLNPIIFVICNKGYTIERLIHGMEDSYNDVQEWKYKDLPAAFGATEGSVKTYRVQTKEELEGLFEDKEFSSGDTQMMRFVELVMPWDDAPVNLKAIAEKAAKANSRVE